ncbi:hypothetical protein Avbf_19106 [Armadillidium vulgare]|nr:hypothetical protein Avbf_19106 [Armadillidium vulgare]
MYCWKWSSWFLHSSAYSKETPRCTS